MKRTMNELLTKNLAAVGVVTFGAVTGIFVIFVSFMGIGVLAGEWDLLHMLAALAMTAGFAALTACCMAVCEWHGIVFWRNTGDKEGQHGSDTLEEAR